MGAVIKPMRHNRGRLPPAPCQAARAPQRGAAGGRPQKTERPHPGRPGPPNPSSCDRARHTGPRA